jgi:hypothetical protein
MTETREFIHTVGKLRDDGAYVVTRRGADSAGNTKVFDDFAALERLYEQLPTEFTAQDVDGTGTGITGSRRHMLVRHLGEHPSFGCAITRHNPLTVTKQSPESRSDDESARAD